MQKPNFDWDDARLCYFAQPLFQFGQHQKANVCRPFHFIIRKFDNDIPYAFFHPVVVASIIVGADIGDTYFLLQMVEFGSDKGRIYFIGYILFDNFCDGDQRVSFLQS